MQRLAAILISLCFLAIGSGVAEFAHNAQHAREDALLEKATGQHSEHHHDDSNCPTHAQLHMPLLAGGWVTVLLCIGLLVAFLTARPTAIVQRGRVLRIDCRGPPRA